MTPMIADNTSQSWAHMSARRKLYPGCLVSVLQDQSTLPTDAFGNEGVSRGHEDFHRISRGTIGLACRETTQQWTGEWIVLIDDHFYSIHVGYLERLLTKEEERKIANS